MIGRVVSFRPRTGKGIVRTDAGDELVFMTNVNPEAVEGDDLVEFVLVSNDNGNGTHHAHVTRLIEKASERLCQQDDLIKQFYGTVQIKRND